MTISEFRKKVKEAYPHVTITVRTVDFTDLVRATAKCLTVKGDRSADELAQINAWAKEAGIVQDGNVRFYK